MSNESATEFDAVQAQLQTLQDALESGTYAQVRRMISGMPSPDIAHLLESSPPRARSILWKLIDPEDQSEVLQDLGDDVRAYFLSRMDTEELLTATDGLDTDDLVDVLQQLPDAVIWEVLESMDTQDRQRVEAALSYPEDTAGGLMNTDTITVRPDITLDVLFRYLRRQKNIPEMTDSLLVVNRRDEFIGLVPLTRLLVSDPANTVREIMSTDAITIHAMQPDTEVAQLFERHDLVSAPVIDDSGRLLGRITIDDVVDVIIEDADHSIMGKVGLDEESDMFAPVLHTTRRRAIWLGINLFTAFIAAAVIGLFQNTIDKVVALAVLMPIVASMGGIAGSQTLTLVVRGMALGHLGDSNMRWLLNREVVVGLLNGMLWALVVSAAAVVWFEDLVIGGVIAAALVINLVVAAASGAVLPLILRRLNIDAALAGGVVLTTITDVVGFFAFLGLATLFYA